MINARWITFDDFELVGYEHHPLIKGKVAI